MSNEALSTGVHAQTGVATTRDLNSNVQLISSAITGRVVQGTEDDKTGQARSAFSDVERALVLARNSNAEALLQAVRLDEDSNVRSFVARVDELQEVDQVEPTKAGVELTERTYRFVARVIDVQSESIVLLVDVSRNTTEAEDMRWSIELDRNEVARISTTDADRIGTTVEQILDVVAKRLQPRPGGAELSERTCQH